MTATDKPYQAPNAFSGQMQARRAKFDRFMGGNGNQNDVMNARRAAIEANLIPGGLDKDGRPLR
jgi:hypothetical protein